MRILFDCSSLFRDGRVESGVPTYALSVLDILKQTEHEIIPFYSGVKTYGLENVVGPFLHLKLPNRLIQILTFCGMNLDWLIERFATGEPVSDKKFEVFLSPNISTFYRYFSPQIKVIGVVHDFSQFLFPELKPWSERLKYLGQSRTHIVEELAFWNRKRKSVLERFDYLVAISEHTKRDLVEFAGVPDEKITLIYPHGTWSPDAQKVGTSMEHGTLDSSSIMEKFNIHKPYLLFLGHIEPRKNVENLIRAFSLLKKERPELQLVVAGRTGYGFKKILKLCVEFAFAFANHYSLTTTHYPDVVFTGHITDEEKYVLMQNAEVFVYPSLYEGFAYPCLEAMSVGTPVVTSPVSALPEVLGDAALYADPLKPESIATTVGDVLKDSELRTRLIQKGRECVKRYQGLEHPLHQWEELLKKI